MTTDPTVAALVEALEPFAEWSRLNPLAEPHDIGFFDATEIHKVRSALDAYRKAREGAPMKSDETLRDEIIADLTAPPGEIEKTLAELDDLWGIALQVSWNSGEKADTLKAAIRAHIEAQAEEIENWKSMAQSGIDRYKEEQRQRASLEAENKRLRAARDRAIALCNEALTDRTVYHLRSCIRDARAALKETSDGK